MMLVLISMLTATILAMAYLASRDNSTDIAANVDRTSALNWAAHSGVNIAVAAMETNADWRTAHTNGTIFENLAIGTSTVTVELVDLQTYLPPDASTSHVQIISSATLDSVTQTAEAIAYVRSGEPLMCVDLSEFAMYAGDRINISNSAGLYRWSVAPSANLALPIWIGTKNVGSNSVTIGSEAQAVDTVLATTTAMSSSALNNAAATIVAEAPMIENMPFPDPPAAPATFPDAGRPYADFVENTGKSVVDTSKRYGTLTITDGGNLKVRNDSNLIIDGDLVINHGGTLLISGNSVVTVFGHMVVDDGSIELRNEGTLTLFIAGSVEVSNAFIGDDDGSEAATATDGTASWLDSQKLVMYSIPSYTPTTAPPDVDDVGGTPPGNPMSSGTLGTPPAGPKDTEPAAETPVLDWTISDDSIIKARLYAPDMDVTVEDGSVLYGQIIGDAIVLRDTAALFYDTNLFDEFGLLNPPDLALADTWNVHSVIANLPSLDPASLDSIADSLNLVVIAAGDRYEPMGYVPPGLAVDAMISSESTYRENAVYYELERMGLDTGYIEFRTTQRTRAEQQAADEGVSVKDIVIVDTIVAAKDAVKLHDLVNGLSVAEFAPKDDAARASETKVIVTRAFRTIDSALARGDIERALANAKWLYDAMLVGTNNDGGAIPDEPYRSQILQQTETLIAKLSTMQ
jgi:hypothetical protein